MRTEADARSGRIFSDDAEHAYTLPSHFYFDSKTYEDERRNIFMRSWSYVCHRSQVAEPGSFVTCEIAGIPIFIVRDREGALRGYHNVCRHRGHKLLEGSGKLGAAITCPYHAWAYGLDGNLRAARNSERVDGFDRADFGLVPVLVEEFCTFVFVNPDTNAPALSEQAAGVEEELRTWMPHLDRITFSRRVEVPVAANWKVVADNFLECYHCDHAHKALVDGVNDMSTYEIRTGGIWSSHISHGSSVSESAYEHAADEHGFVGFFLWPNTTLGSYPGPRNMVNHIFRPVGPEKCLQIFDFLFESPEPTAAEEEVISYMRDVLAPEDNALMEGVQQGVRSPAYMNGRLMVDADRTYLSEHAVHHFQKMVFEALQPR